MITIIVTITITIIITSTDSPTRQGTGRDARITE